MEFKRFVNSLIQLPCQIVKPVRAAPIGCCRGTRGSNHYCG